MAGSRRRWHGWVAAGALAVVLGGCKDSGLANRNLPLSQAEHRTDSYPAYQQSPASQEIWELAGVRWQASAQVETIDANLLGSVANANGTAMYALTSDPAPYDQLYTPIGENRWRTVVPID